MKSPISIYKVEVRNTYYYANRKTLSAAAAGLVYTHASNIDRVHTTRDPIGAAASVIKRSSGKTAKAVCSHCSHLSDNVPNAYHRFLKTILLFMLQPMTVADTLTPRENLLICRPHDLQWWQRWQKHLSWCYANCAKHWERLVLKIVINNCELTRRQEIQLPEWSAVLADIRWLPLIA